MHHLHSPALRLANTCALRLAFTALLTACGASGVSSRNVFAPDRSAPAGPERSSFREIVRAEILADAAVSTNAYEVVRRLRPSWLRGRGRPSFVDPNAGDPVVYIDEFMYGLLDSLYRISPDDISRIVFIGAADATTRWGIGHADGVISIITIRGG